MLAVDFVQSSLQEAAAVYHDGTFPGALDKDATFKRSAKITRGGVIGGLGTEKGCYRARPIGSCLVSIVMSALGAAAAPAQTNSGPAPEITICSSHAEVVPRISLDASIGLDRGAPKCPQDAATARDFCATTKPVASIGTAFNSAHEQAIRPLAAGNPKAFESWPSSAPFTITSDATNTQSGPPTPTVNPTSTSTVGKCADFSLPMPERQLPANALGDEFVGPFANWMDVKRDFGAIGDGVRDDTAALQAALNALTPSQRGPVLWIPSGTYRITKTLTLAGGTGLSMIGEHPATTMLKWAGPKDGIMLHIDGVAYSRFDRLTFDGSETAGVLVDQSVTDYAGGRRFDTGNEYADDIFENAGIGIQGGQYGKGAAESSVLRSKFLNLRAGIALRNFNSLDWWIWYSYFENNDFGISNNLDENGAGNFHAYNNVFKGSKSADIFILNTGQFNFRDNWSSGSAAFLFENYYYTNAATTRLQGNTIIIPTKNRCSGCGMYVGNMGPVVMTDNTWVSPAGATNPPALVGSLNPPDCVSIGNTYTVEKPVYCSSPNGSGRLITLDDKVVPAASIDQTPPTLPAVPPRYDRRTFEVAAHSGSATIQEAIARAASLCGQRPIVHLPHGFYPVTQTIVIPANCDIQLVGDGSQAESGTSLLWVGNIAGPALRLQGPSRAILRDFYVKAERSIGIEVLNADQQGARIFGEQLMVNRATGANIFVDGLDYALVELHDFELAYTAIPPATTGVALKVVGGPLAQQGKPQYGRTNLLAGSGAANYVSFEASKGASLLVRDTWIESNNPSTYAEVSESSSVTLEGSRMALPMNGDSIRIDNSVCRAAIIASAPDSAINVAGDHTGTIWVMGNNFGQAKSWWSNHAVNGVAAFDLNRRTFPSEGSIAIPDPNQPPAADLIRTMLAQSRTAHPTQIKDLPAGVTDVRFYRVSVELGRIGIHLAR